MLATTDHFLPHLGIRLEIPVEKALDDGGDLLFIPFQKEITDLFGHLLKKTVKGLFIHRKNRLPALNLPLHRASGTGHDLKSPAAAQTCPNSGLIKAVIKKDPFE